MTLDYSMAAIGRRLAQKRNDAKLSVLEAAKSAMMSHKVLGTLERGQATSVSDELLEKLALLYRSHPAFFRYGVDVEPLGETPVTPLFQSRPAVRELREEDYFTPAELQALKQQYPLPEDERT